MSESESYTKAEFFRKPNLSKNLPNVSKCGLNTRHDNREVTLIHLFIWHKRKLCALTNAPPVQSTHTGQWLSTLFHPNCSAAQVYVLYPRQFIFALSCRRHHFCRYYHPQSARKDILKNFLWQMSLWKHVLSRNCKKNRIWLRQWRITYVRQRQLSEGRIFPKTEFVQKFTECSKVWIEHTAW